VRRDLADDFARLRRRSKHLWTIDLLAAVGRSGNRPGHAAERKQVVLAAEKTWSQYEPDNDMGRFLLRLFRRAALRILVQHGKAADVRFARRLATDGDSHIRVEALRLFERFGTSHDAATVLELADQVYGEEERQRGAETALRLAYKKDKLAVLAELRKIRSVRVWAVERLAEVPEGLAVALELLHADEPDVRLAAADVVWSLVRPDMADHLLSLYMQRRYFYNVVRAIDRRMYAPDWLRDALPAGG
jgi:hypothetical protein